MDQDHLEFDGKKYISSGRAAGLVGYTKDYVGQLARAGKLEARLVGRNWYVSEDSIRKHKLAVHYTLTKPKKSRPDELYTENTIHRKENSFVDDIDISVHANQQTLPRSNSGRVGDYARQELVRADVRYEVGESLEYDAGSYVPALRNAPEKVTLEPSVSHEATRSLPIAMHDFGASVAVRGRDVSRPRHSARRGQRVLPQAQRVDGIAIVTRPQRSVEERTPARSWQRSPASASKLSHRPATPNVLMTPVARPSKRVPVVVSLVVFALFCIWYWFVR